MQRSVIRPDLTTLRIFLSVCNLGNISKAAEREHIAPSAVSKRIHALEAELGTELFYRSIKGMSPTPAGETLARHAITICGSVEQMAAELSIFTRGLKGQVRIHAHTSALFQFLPEQLSQFVQYYPGVRIILREEKSSYVVQAVVDGFADIGILPSHMDIPPFLETSPYRTDRLAALVPTGHPLARRATIDFREIRESSFISMETGSSLQMLVTQAAETCGFALRVSVEVMSFESAKAMVKAGLGIAIIPESVIEESEIAGQARRVDLSDAWALREHVICVRDEQRLTGSAALMLQHLRGPLAVPVAAKTSHVRAAHG